MTQIKLGKICTSHIDGRKYASMETVPDDVAFYINKKWPTLYDILHWYRHNTYIALRNRWSRI